MMYLDQGDLAAPRASNLQAADVLAGTHAFGAILAALRRRDRTGQGAYLDVSMLEALVAADDVSYAAVLNGGEAQGSPRPAMGVYAVGDRHLALQTGGAAALWPRLQELLGRPDLATDPRFATPDLRRRNWPALRDIIGEWVGRFASRGGGARGAAGRAHPGRAGAQAGRGGGAPAPGRARRVPHRAPPGPRRGAGDRRAVPARRPAGACRRAPRPTGWASTPARC